MKIIYIANLRTLYAVALVALIGIVGFIGCSNSQELQSQNTIKVKVGSEGAYKPYSYVDKEGKVTGYDVEVLRILEKIDPTLSFEFNLMFWLIKLLKLQREKSGIYLIIKVILFQLRSLLLGQMRRALIPWRILRVKLLVVWLDRHIQKF